MKIIKYVRLKQSTGKWLFSMNINIGNLPDINIVCEVCFDFFSLFEQVQSLLIIWKYETIIYKPHTLTTNTPPQTPLDDS
jgi:hypothetical protein